MKKKIAMAMLAGMAAGAMLCALAMPQEQSCKGLLTRVKDALGL